jgi:hypothetical protein
MLALHCTNCSSICRGLIFSFANFFGLFLLLISFSIVASAAVLYQNNKYHTVGTISKQQIPHCRDNIKTTNATLSRQYQNNKYHTVETISKQQIPHCRDNIKFVERGKKYTLKSQIHDCTLSWLGTCASTTSSALNLVKESYIRFTGKHSVSEIDHHWSLMLRITLKHKIPCRLILKRHNKYYLIFLIIIYYYILIYVIIQ